MLLHINYLKTDKCLTVANDVCFDVSGESFQRNLPTPQLREVL